MRLTMLKVLKIRVEEQWGSGSELATNIKGKKEKEEEKRRSNEALAVH